MCYKIREATACSMALEHKDYCYLKLQKELHPSHAMSLVASPENTRFHNHLPGSRTGFLCSLGCPGTSLVDYADLNLPEIHLLLYLIKGVHIPTRLTIKTQLVVAHAFNLSTWEK